MEYALQQALNAATVGSVYALVAMGYTMIHGITGQFNLAHGEFLMIGGFTGFIVIVLAGILGVAPGAAGLALALFAAALVSALHGWAVQRTIFRPLARAPGHAPLVATIGLAIFLREYARLAQGSEFALRPPFPAGSWVLFEAAAFPVHFGHKQMLIMAATAAAVAILALAIARSGFGRAQRASAQDRTMAALCGIDTRRTIGLTFAVAAALAGVAGVLVTIHYGYVTAYMGFMLGLKGLIAAILGGVGSLAGALAGGLLLGFFETFWSGYLPMAYRDVAVFGVLVAVLVFRPSGIFRAPGVERLPGPGAPRH